MYLDSVVTLRPSKSYGLWGGVGWVAHKILVSAQGPLVFGIWVWGLQKCRFVDVYYLPQLLCDLCPDIFPDAGLSFCFLITFVEVQSLAQM